MPVTDARNYSLTFGLLSGFIPETSRAYEERGLSADDASLMQATFCHTAEDHGLMAAAYRVVNEGANVAETESADRYHKIMTRVWSEGDIQVAHVWKVPHHPAGSTHDSISISVKGQTVYDSGKKQITGGAWMQDFNARANRVPIYPYETGGISHAVWRAAETRNTI